MTREADKFWNEVSPILRRVRGLELLSPEEADAEFDAASKAMISRSELNTIIQQVISLEGNRLPTLSSHRKAATPKSLRRQKQTCRDKESLNTEKGTSVVVETMRDCCHPSVVDETRLHSYQRRLGCELLKDRQLLSIGYWGEPFVHTPGCRCDEQFVLLGFDGAANVKYSSVSVTVIDVSLFSTLQHHQVKPANLCISVSVDQLISRLARNYIRFRDDIWLPTSQQFDIGTQSMLTTYPFASIGSSCPFAEDAESGHNTANHAFISPTVGAAFSDMRLLLEAISTDESADLSGYTGDTNIEFNSTGNNYFQTEFVILAVGCQEYTSVFWTVPHGKVEESYSCEK